MAKAPKITKTVNMSEDKEKALATAVEQIERQYGKGTVMRLGENVSMNVEHIRTGSIALEIVAGSG